MSRNFLVGLRTRLLSPKNGSSNGFRVTTFLSSIVEFPALAFSKGFRASMPGIKGRRTERGRKERRKTGGKEEERSGGRDCGFLLIVIY